MGYSVAGKSLVAFGAASLISSVIEAFLLDAVTVEPLAAAVVALGLSVSGGSARAARWSVAVMALYLSVTAALLVVCSLHLGMIWVEGRSAGAANLPWLLATLMAVAARSAANIALLRRALRSARPAAEPPLHPTGPAGNLSDGSSLPRRPGG